MVNGVSFVAIVQAELNKTKYKQTRGLGHFTRQIFLRLNAKLYGFQGKHFPYLLWLHPWSCNIWPAKTKVETVNLPVVNALSVYRSFLSRNIRKPLFDAVSVSQVHEIYNYTDMFFTSQWQVWMRAFCQVFMQISRPTSHIILCYLVHPHPSLSLTKVGL